MIIAAICPEVTGLSAAALSHFLDLQSRGARAGAYDLPYG